MENQRIRLTKKMLKSALIKLLESKPIEKVTVYELCAEAQINRTTFYKYYGSQHDLMADIQADFLAELENSLRETDRPLSLLMILTYIGTHRETCIVLMNNALNDGFQRSETVFLQDLSQLEAQL
jgi:AcrR family transcriptional regulator